MKIAELFYSIQGEGLMAGLPSVFIRLSGCNLRCRWCDTPYASWRPEGKEMDIDRILAETAAFPAGYVVLTGGEPMIAPHIGKLTRELKNRGYHITIETAGTVYHPVRCDLASVSPKLSNSTPRGMIRESMIRKHERLRINMDVLKRFVKNHPCQFKFVVETPEDMCEIEELLAQLPEIKSDRVLLMPQGKTPEELSQKTAWVTEACKTRGFRYGARLHIDLFGNTRGT